MHRSLTHFLGDMFPDAGLPRYQSVAEKLSFVLVTAMLIGSLVSSLAILVYEL